ncbi:hypothetical protein Cni_G07021 [Canna indica]|uniref:FLZ-type domain-containing protein n=1 Tax=Canna indica TaxID=4628 RepID=A0AAQ3JY27_9LILI|nr:hypothetical protein Cni_G07021 [Canna indica]
MYPAMSPSADQKRRSSLAKLAHFFGFGDSSSAPPTTPSPAQRSFPSDGTVGLGIVAAMSAADAPALVAPKAEKRRVPPAEEMVMCESNTSLISNLGGRRARKRVYYGDCDDGIASEPSGGKGVLFELPPPPSVELAPSPLHPTAFLWLCFHCKRELDGLDIYIYRGDKAFCSVECRSRHMVIDELSEKFRNGGKRKHDCSMSPSPAPSLTAAEVTKA